jgi:hypothetical protein
MRDETNVIVGQACTQSRQKVQTEPTFSLEIATLQLRASEFIAGDATLVRQVAQVALRILIWQSQ